ncbi:hypothetical protein ABU614_08535 [Lysobacter firmicutimachus]|uniref:Phage holin family protein n=1 Tax=Lysobacter firmicutimachus TaxID=1792846 RepID=A0AAU8MXW5_9GAMM
MTGKPTEGSAPKPADFTSALDAQFDAIENTIDGDTRSDARTSVHAWKASVEADRLKSELAVIGEKIKSQAETREMRKEYALKALGLAQAAVGFWMMMFAMAATVNVIQNRPWLSDQALITLTAGCTVNVIAVFLVVVKGLFPSKNGDEGTKSEVPKS